MSEKMSTSRVSTTRRVFCCMYFVPADMLPDSTVASARLCCMHRSQTSGRGNAAAFHQASPLALLPACQKLTHWEDTLGHSCTQGLPCKATVMRKASLEPKEALLHGRGRTVSSMRRESKPPRYMLMVCRTKEAMPRSICPALALPCARALLASCKTIELEDPACKPALSGAAWRALTTGAHPVTCTRASLGHRSMLSYLEHHSQGMQYSVNWTACSSCDQRLSWKS